MNWLAFAITLIAVSTIIIGIIGFAILDAACERWEFILGLSLIALAALGVATFFGLAVG